MNCAMTSVMRALESDGSTVRLNASRPTPELQPGDAVVRPTRVAASALDALIAGVDQAAGVANRLNGFIGVLGRSFVGVVERVENCASNDLVGKRVVGSAVTWCGRCDMCTAGFRMHCRHRTMLGIHGRDGCLAEHLTLPAVNLHVVPNSIDDDCAVFANYLAAALQTARQLTIQGRPYITVLGDGPLGLLMAQVTARMNASVRLLGRHQSKFSKCEKWGIKHRHIDEVGRRADQDIVIDCSGSADGFTTAMALARPRGTVVLKSLLGPSATMPADLSPIVLNELQVIGSWCGPLNEAITELQCGNIDVVSLISRRMRLDEGAAILKAAARPDTITVLVDV